METKITNFEQDIPRETARGAFYNLSHDPDRRGDSAIREYSQTLDQIYQRLIAHANTPEKLELLDQEFAQLRAGYQKRTLNWLHSESRCMSSFITGPSNFPVDRARKRSEIAHKRMQECLDFEKWAEKEILKKLHPEWRPIMSGDQDAQSRLREKLEKAKANQELYKKINQAIRKANKQGPEAQIKMLMELDPRITEESAKLLLKGNSFDGQGIPSYQLTNNNANIRRMEQRLAQITRDQAKPKIKAEGTAARLEDSPADNRIRLFFPGKPNEETRTKLKKNGFRWTPSLGCWQAYRNSWSIQLAKETAGIQ